MTANAAVHSIYPTLESLVIEYDRAVVLPQQSPAALYTFTDALNGNSSRAVTSVYSTDQSGTRVQGPAQPGRFVHIELEPVANPNPDAAGRAVIRTG